MGELSGPVFAIYSFHDLPNAFGKNAGKRGFDPRTNVGDASVNYYLFAGYCVIWFLLFVYVFSLRARQSSLERTLEGIQNQLDRQK